MKTWVTYINTFRALRLEFLVYVFLVFFFFFFFFFIAHFARCTDVSLFFRGSGWVYGCLVWFWGNLVGL